MKSKKMSNFYKISTFSYFNIDLWRYFYTQICKTGYHSKACGIGRAMKVTASRLLNYTGHSGPKTEFRGQKSKIVSENRKSIFRSKQMPISVIMGPNESKKIGRYSGTKWLLHSVISATSAGIHSRPSAMSFQRTPCGIQMSGCTYL